MTLTVTPERIATLRALCSGGMESWSREVVDAARTALPELLDEVERCHQIVGKYPTEAQGLRAELERLDALSKEPLAVAVGALQNLQVELTDPAGEDRHCIACHALPYEWDREHAGCRIYGALSMTQAALRELGEGGG